MVGLTGDHDISDASMTERRHDWSGLRLESVLHHDQTSQPQITFHYFPARVRTLSAALVAPISCSCLQVLLIFRKKHCSKPLPLLFISFKTVPLFYLQNISLNFHIFHYVTWTFIIVVEERKKGYLICTSSPSQPCARPCAAACEPRPTRGNPAESANQEPRGNPLELQQWERTHCRH